MLWSCIRTNYKENTWILVRLELTKDKENSLQTSQAQLVMLWHALINTFINNIKTVRHMEARRSQ